MRPLDLATIRPRLQQALDDIDYFLDCDNKRENDREEAGKLYDLIEAGWTPPEGLRKPPRLTKTQYMALVYGTKLRRKKRSDEPLDERQGKPLTDKEREAIIAELDLEHVEVTSSDARRKSLAFWARGGWLESSRQAAVWLRKLKENVAADGIDEALRPLLDEPRDAVERSCLREAMRTAAEYVKTILAMCIEGQPPNGDDRGAKKSKHIKAGPRPKSWSERKDDCELAEDWERYQESVGTGKRATYKGYVDNRDRNLNPSELSKRVKNFYDWLDELPKRQHQNEVEADFAKRIAPGLSIDKMKELLRWAKKRKDIRP